MDKIKKLIGLIKLYHAAKSADLTAEKDGLARFAKTALAGALAVVLQLLLDQVGPNCGLGPDTCASLASPLMTPLYTSAIMGVFKYIQGKTGIKVPGLDTAEALPKV